jgi:hypothetical protein
VLEEYLYIDRTRIRSYAEQIGAAMTTDKLPQWKVGLALTGPSVEGQQTASVRSASDHEMITAVVDYLRKNHLLLLTRPISDAEADRTQTRFVLETMRARKVVFRCDPTSSPGGLREIAVWVSNPVEKPPDISQQPEDKYEPRGMFVYLIEGYWENDSFQRAMSMYTALNVLLGNLQKLGVYNGDSDLFSTSRNDYASPTAILERAGGVKGEVRGIKALYRIRSVSDNKIVNVGGRTLRSYDLFGYPVFISAA